MTTATEEIPATIKRTRVPAPKPSIYPGVPFAEYAAWSAINQSALKLADRSLAHVAHALTVVDDEPGEALVLGQATHTLALEGPAAFDERFFVMPKVNRSTNVGKAAHAAALVQAAGRQLLTEPQHELVVGMAEAIEAHPRAAKLIGAKGTAETAIVWVDAKTGLHCKMRMDRIIPGGITPDVKTTRNASRPAFRKAIADYGYAEQQAFYELGYEAAFGKLPDFCIIAVENEPPHGVAVYTIGEDTMRIARKRIRLWLNQVAHADRTNNWPAYVEAIEEIDAPEWWIKQKDPHTPEIEGGY